MHDWHNFSYETRNLYGVDMTPLSRQYEVRACVRACVGTCIPQTKRMPPPLT